MKPSLKLRLETALITFVSGFLTAFGSSITNISMSSLSWNVVWGLIVAAIGIAGQSVYNSFIPSSTASQLKTGAVVAGASPKV